MTNAVEKVIAGDVRTVARLIRDIDDRVPEVRETLKALYAHTGHAYVVGITGAPGVGKSTLVDQMVAHLRKTDKTVGVLAVDPTSPFSGGAILGDRIRMQRHSLDEGVFIRSLATRGHFGGLTQSTRSAIDVLDAMGKDYILVETVGVGQDEVDVVKSAQTTIIMVIPGMGDDIQAIKAGILEIADILVVNKSDLPGVENTERALRGMLELAHPVRHVYRHHDRTEVVDPSGDHKDPVWIPPIVRTMAVEGKGIPELADAIARHAGHLRQSGEWTGREHARLRSEVEALIQESLARQFRQRIPEDCYQSVLSEVFNHRLSPWAAVQSLLDGRCQ